MSKALPVLENGSPVYVRGMAASSIASKDYKLMTCGDCGFEVAWAESAKGKWYLCKVVSYTTEGMNSRHRAMPYVPHYSECGKNQDRQTQAVSDAEYAEAVTAWYALEERAYEQAGKPTGDLGRTWSEAYKALNPRPTKTA